MIIQIRHKEGCSLNRIAAEIGCAPNTVRNELRRGTIDLYNGHVQRYKARQGQQAYEQNRSNCCRHYDRLAKNRFIAYIDRHVREDGWSLDVCQGRAFQSGEFTREEVTCTKTLYNYVDLGLTQQLLVASEEAVMLLPELCKPDASLPIRVVKLADYPEKCEFAAIWKSVNASPALTCLVDLLSKKYESYD